MYPEKVIESKEIEYLREDPRAMKELVVELLNKIKWIGRLFECRWESPIVFKTNAFTCAVFYVRLEKF